MGTLDSENWDVDVVRGRAVHRNGFNLEVEGDVRNPSGVTPADYPPGTSFVEQAQLLRSGMEALAAAAGGSAGTSRPKTVNRKARQAGEKARLFAEQRKERPARPKLSLKRSDS